MIKILLIEDDLDDVELLEDALTTNGASYNLTVLKDGSVALKHLSTSQEPPHIIILDYNLPKVHGKEVIAAIKSNINFQNVPLLILTTSSSADDIAYAYNNGANKYLMKPTDVSQIKETIQVILSLATV